MERERGDVYRNRLMAAAGIALSLGLVAGCSSGDGEDGNPLSKGRGPQGGASAPEGPAYQGPALPGLAKQPAWSLSGVSAPYGMGDTLVFAKDGMGEIHSVYGDLGTEVGPRDSGSLEFRDRKTGEVRGTVKVSDGHVGGTTWHGGVPAIQVRTVATTPSDGLSAEKQTVTITLYDGSGKKLGQIERAGDDSGLHVQDGYLIEQGEDPRQVTATAIDTGAVKKFSCENEMEDDSCFDGEGAFSVGAEGSEAPLITGDHYFSVIGGSRYGADWTKKTHLVMHEMATGKKVWSSQDVTPPKGVKLWQGERSDSDLEVLRVADGKIVTRWGAGGLDESVIATYDLTSPDSLATGPAYESEGQAVLDHRQQLAATTTENGALVWDLATGEKLWDQQEGETPMTAQTLSPTGVLYGTQQDNRVDADKTVIAVEARTKKVLAKDLPEQFIPHFDQTDHAWIATQEGVFVFATASP